MSTLLQRMRARIKPEEFDIDESEEPIANISSDLLNKVGMNNASDLQKDIFNFFNEQITSYQNTSTAISLAIQAVAGSGKSTTIIAAAKLIPKKYNAIFLAFNKSIADELRGRLPSHVEARTLNSLGWRLLLPYLNSIGVKDPAIRSTKTQTLIRSSMNFQEVSQYGKPVGSLVALCKSMGIVPVGCSDGIGIDNQEATDPVLTQIVIHHNIQIDAFDRPMVFQKVRNILKESFSDSRIYDSGMVDYNDQKWLTVCKRPKGMTLAQPLYDVILVDESQDVNDIDIELIKMVLKPGGIVVAVGDSFQSIYGWRGADANAFGKIINIFNAKELPLSITYRCGVELVKHAQELVPHIQAAPNAVTGEVIRYTEIDPEMFSPGDLVMCRNNAPLLSFAYKLILARIPVKVKGRDIGTGLIDLISDLVGVKKWVNNPLKPGKKKPEITVDGVTTKMLVIELAKWLRKQHDIIIQEDPDNEAAIQSIQDKHDSIMVFVNTSVDGKVSSVIDDINSIFTEESDRDVVLCSTIHKAKGLEADKAYIYAPEKMYPAWVKKGSWQYQQEANMDYVARTRGKIRYGYLPEDAWKK